MLFSTKFDIFRENSVTFFFIQHFINIRQLIFKENAYGNKRNRTNEIKEKIAKILNSNDLLYFLVTYQDSKGIFIPTGDSENYRTYPGIAITMCNKDICKVYPHEIIYIAIKDRKSVLYLTDGKIETHYPMEHWKEVLDEKSFAQPHYRYIVNLHYVEEVTKDFVKLKHVNKEYSVYTSSRRIGVFRKAFLKFGEQ